MVHAPVALIPMSFPESHWKQACEVAPIFNELVDRVSQDGEFLQQSLSRLVHIIASVFAVYWKHVLEQNTQLSSKLEEIMVVLLEVYEA